MKIGILTLQYADNYGAMLQAYGLQKYIRDKFCADVEQINYLPIDYYKNYAVLSIHNLQFYKQYIERIVKVASNIKQKKKFRSFRKKDLTLTKAISTPAAYSKLVRKYSTVIFGSDQIWNNQINGQTALYYGEYVIPERRIYYAGSFGNDVIDDYQKRMIQEYFPNSVGVSCREEKGVNVIADILGNSRQVYCVCDPVFLLDVEDWVKLERKMKLESDDYILYYALSLCEELNNQTLQLAQKTGLDIYVVHPLHKKHIKGGKVLDKVGPKEFLALIHNAKYVCTNSFHALCFSIIYKKKTVAVPPKQKGDRLMQVLNFFADEVNDENGVKVFSMDVQVNEFNEYVHSSKEYLYLSMKLCMHELNE